MPEVRVIKIVFDTELKDYEIPAFRGAIIEKVGREHVVFHNHIGDDRFHYKYPVVQYKNQGRKAAIVCIKDGVDEIHHFFSKNSGDIHIGDEKRSLRVENVKINKFQVQVWDRYHPLQQGLRHFLLISFVFAFITQKVSSTTTRI